MSRLRAAGCKVWESAPRSRGESDHLSDAAPEALSAGVFAGRTSSSKPLDLLNCSVQFCCQRRRSELRECIGELAVVPQRALSTSVEPVEDTAADRSQISQDGARVVKLIGTRNQAN